MNAAETRKRVSVLNRNCNLIGTGLTVLLLAGLYVFMFRPVLAESARIEKLESATQAFLENSDKITRETREAQSHSASLDKDMARVLAGVPESPNESEFLGQLATLAREASLKLGQFRPGQTTQTDTHRQLEVELTGHGNYPAICRFLAGLSELERLCRLQTLDITSNDDAGSDQYPVRMTLVIFFSPLDTSTDQDKKNPKAKS